jgi:hypothetical protein
MFVLGGRCGASLSDPTRGAGLGGSDTPIFPDSSTLGGSGGGGRLSPAYASCGTSSLTETGSCPAFKKTFSPRT